MKTEVTLDLRNKIRTDMKIVANHETYSNGDYCGLLYFDKKEKDLFKECIIWKRMLDTYFKSSYNGGKLLKVGRFVGIKPAAIHSRCVEFAVSTFSNPSWKDWFNIEGEEDDNKIIK